MRLPKALVSRCSPVLERLVNGEMSEASNGVAEIKDFEKTTFAHFAEWLYTGRYKIDPLEESPGPESFERGSDSFAAKKKSKKEKRVEMFSSRHKKEAAWAKFISQSTYQPTVPPRTNSIAKYSDPTEELLGHAKLCCFADKYGIVSLADLCLGNLKTSLINCECQDNQVQGLAELLTFTIMNTLPLGDRNKESLRSVVLDYTIIVFEQISENETFQQLMEGGGDVVKEILLLLRQRLD